MRFDDQSYINLLHMLQNNRYQFRGYHDYDTAERCVILRHDIDQSIEQAVRMAELEAKQGVSSTYFVLLTSEFYNTASMNARKGLHKIQELGHEVGLHFDEVAYGKITQQECIDYICKESQILSELLDTPVTTVSMHRPSKSTLEADFKIPGIINSYGQTFFHDFKYLSDSRRRWREPVEEIIQSGVYDRLHILTHAFWYRAEERPMKDVICEFIQNASAERYRQMSENITDLAAVLNMSHS